MLPLFWIHYNLPLVVELRFCLLLLLLFPEVEEAPFPVETPADLELSSIDIFTAASTSFCFILLSPASESL